MGAASAYLAAAMSNRAYVFCSLIIVVETCNLLMAKLIAGSIGAGKLTQVALGPRRRLMVLS